MLVYFIISVIIVLLAIIFSIVIINNNRFQIINIKIHEAENNINSLLKQKYELLIEIGKFIKKKTKEETFDKVETINAEELDMFSLNEELSKYDKNITEYVDYNRDINFNDKELEAFDNYSNLNISCLASEKYYNDTVIYFNRLIKKFPTKIHAKLKGYTEKKLFENKKEEIFEILKK